ncbi:MAG: hypothetical protein ACI82N_000958, partial [Maricaulis sp.]
MFVRVALVAMALCASVTGQILAQGNQDDPSANTLDQIATEGTRIEERTLADLETGMDAFVLSSSQPRTRIRFYLPPNTYAGEAWLRLAARPASDNSSGRIQVSI